MIRTGGSLLGIALLVVLGNLVVGVGVNSVQTAAVAADSAGVVMPPEATGPASKLHSALLRELSQENGLIKTWVFFTDKGIASPEAYQAAIGEVTASYNQRAIQRRNIRGLNAERGGEVFDEHDLPVVREYVDAVTATGARLHLTSNWVNAVSVWADRAQIEQIAALPFVSKLQPVAKRARQTPPVLHDLIVDPAPADDGGAGPRTINYGASQSQLAQMNLIALHDAGYTASGVIIGMLDSGFHRTHAAFTDPSHPLVVLAEWDFVMNDGNTDTQPGDYSGQADHGTMTLSCLGAYKLNQYVGGAYNASFVLAKTEDTSQEVPAEEDNYVAGIEFLEAHGADMATSSLGYIDWYTQAQLNGLTAVTTIAVNLATTNGLHFCNAAGNEYHDSDPNISHLIAPADAFKVISCGAVDSTGYIAYFSSDGPTADGRVKPELLARGVSASVVSPTSNTAYTTADGTSFATPLTACSVACLIQARPYWNVDQMRQHLFETTTDYVANGTYDPLYVRGYGIVDAFAAYNSGPNPPEAQNVAATTAVSVPTNITLAATDDGEPNPPGGMTYIIATLPTHGALSDPGAGAITAVPYSLVGGAKIVHYAPVAGYHGADSFQFKAGDGGTPPTGGTSDPAVVTITVGGPAWDPVANNTNVSLPMSTPSNVTLSATDPNADPLTYSVQSLPVASKGLLFDPGAGQITSTPYTLVGGGKVVRYLPPFGRTVVTSFTFSVHDATAGSNVATVSINVGNNVPQQVYFFPMNTNPGWTTDGMWAFGQPTGGGSHGCDPTSGYTGSNVYGYNLNGDYANNMSQTQYLTTTALDCANVTQAQLRFRRWLAVEAGQFDHANVQVSSNGAAWTTVWSNASSSGISETAWSLQTYDISAVADGHSTVYLRWGMGSTDASTTYPGWNIDDVEFWGVLHQSCMTVALGDVNLDGQVDGRDVQAFVKVLMDPYSPSLTFSELCAADIDHDGFITPADVGPFVQLLLGL
jgi:hypothetical protein